MLNQSIIHEPPNFNRLIEAEFKSFPLYVKKEFIYDHQQRLHVQPGVEINLTLEGTGTYIIGNQICTQIPGQLIIFPGNTPHQIYVKPSAPYSRIVICIEYNQFNEGVWRSLFPSMDLNWLSLLDCHQIQLKSEIVTQIKWIVSLMSSELQFKSSGWQTVIASQLISLSVMIRRIVDEVDENKVRASFPLAQASTIPLCCRYIKEHMHEDLSLKKIAAMFYVSPEHLTRQFKKKVGLPFYQYVLTQRVDAGKKMLMNNPEWSLIEVAFSAGFSSPAHFSRVFKSLTQMSPHQFRREYRHKK